MSARRLGFGSSADSAAILAIVALLQPFDSLLQQHIAPRQAWQAECSERHAVPLDVSLALRLGERAGDSGLGFQIAALNLGRLAPGQGVDFTRAGLGGLGLAGRWRVIATRRLALGSSGVTEECRRASIWSRMTEPLAQRP